MNRNDNSPLLHARIEPHSPGGIGEGANVKTPRVMRAEQDGAIFAKRLRIILKIGGRVAGAEDVAIDTFANVRNSGRREFLRETIRIELAENIDRLSIPIISFL